MGCDIHAHIEIKVYGEWLYYSPASIERWYLAFSKMAGVRGSSKPISSPRGLPSDISKMTQLHRNEWGIDGHSDSWLSHNEIVKLIDWLEEENPQEGLDKYEYSFLGKDVWLFGNPIYSFQKYRSDYPEFIEDIRLVFWFDN